MDLPLAHVYFSLPSPSNHTYARTAAEQHTSLAYATDREAPHSQHLINIMAGAAFTSESVELLVRVMGSVAGSIDSSIQDPWSRQTSRSSAPSASGSEHQHHPDNFKWMIKMLSSSEAIALLHLAAKHASGNAEPKIAAADAVLGTESIEVGAPFGEKIVQLATLPFEYDVIARFGPKVQGRCVALRPKHLKNRIILAFGGVRSAMSDDSKEMQSCARNDCAAASSAHGKPMEGFPIPNSSGADMKVHAGIFEYHNTLWTQEATTASDGVELRRWIGKLSVKAQMQPDFELLLVGQSMGGALAEMTALRIALTHPNLEARLHVLCFGSLTWAEAGICNLFNSRFGSRSVHLVLSRRERESPLPTAQNPEHPSWWNSFYDETLNAESIVFDPLATRLVGSKESPSTNLRNLSNVIVFNLEGFVDKEATALLGRASLKTAYLTMLLKGKLSRTDPPSDQLMNDYLDLHVGGRYRRLLANLCLKMRSRASDPLLALGGTVNALGAATLRGTVDALGAASRIVPSEVGSFLQSTLCLEPSRDRRRSPVRLRPVPMGAEERANAFESEMDDLTMF